MSSRYEDTMIPIRIKEVRISHEDTIAQLSVKTGISERTLIYYETPTAEVDFNDIVSIAMAYLINFEYLLGADVEPELTPGMRRSMMKLVN
jgi:transcriptional regulator with XRE-family HTH domain